MRTEKTKTPRTGLAAFGALILIFCMLLTGCTQIKDFFKKTINGNTPEPVVTASPVTEAPATEVPATDEPAVTEVPVTESPTSRPISDGPFAGAVLPGGVRLNYFAIPQKILDLMTDGDIEMYKRVVTAYFAGETSAEIPEGKGDYPNLWRLVDMYCPVFFADVDDTTVTESKTEIAWSYNTDRGMTHDEVIEAFENTVLGLLENVDMNDPLIVRVLSLYHAYTFTIEYCGDTVIPKDDSSPYVYRHSVNAILDHTGVCWCFGRSFNFLLCQSGVESATVHGLRSGDRAIHEWTVFFDGEKWRYCDPTWDIGGGTLSYFGFTAVFREFQGYPEADVTVLEGRAHPASEVFGVNDTFFRPLYTCIVCGMDYDLVKEDDRINYFYYSSYDGSRVYTTWFNYVTGEYGEF